MDDQPPAYVPVPDGGTHSAKVPSAFHALGKPETSCAALPHQVPYDDTSAHPPGKEHALASGPAGADTAALAADRLSREISEELFESRLWLRAVIYRNGYDDPALSVLENETQVRYYKARSKPDFILKHGPKAFLRACLRRAQADFHRQEGRWPEPVAEFSESRSYTGESAVDLVTLREATKTFLEEHLPDEKERKVYVLTYQDGMRRKEIAEQLGIDRGTVAKRLKRAEKRLKSLSGDQLNALL